MKTHVAIVPCPTVGHITPMMELANLVATRGFMVTVVLFQEGPLHPPSSPGVVEEEQEQEQEREGGVRVVNFPIQVFFGHGSSKARATLESIEVLGPSLTSLLSRIRPPISCIVSDYIVLATKEAAIVGVFKEQKKIYGIPGFQRALATQDLPWVSSTDNETEFFTNLMRSVIKSWEGNPINLMISNGVYELERHIIDTLLHLAGITILPIGPLFLHFHTPQNPHIPTTTNSSIEDGSSYPAIKTRANGNNISASWKWKEDSDCLPWLNQQHAKSVLYVSFGSITIFQKTQFDEIALALEESGHPFLWVIRPDLISGAPIVLPHGFLERVHGHQGFVTSWVPQVIVLEHPAVGGFLTHCGWNSTIESISMGVPMLAWPYFAEQSINRSFITEDWNVGLAMDSISNFDSRIVYRDELKRMIHRLMKTNARELNQSCQAWKQITTSAIREGGSSYASFNKFVEYLTTLSQE